MKKTLIIITLIFLILIIFKIGDWTGFFRIHNVVMFSNEPTLEPGDWILSSSIPKPKRFDFIIYKPQGIENSYGNWSHRICGVENDTIQIRKGVLYVNGINVDKNLELKHSYLISPNDFSELKNKIDIQEHNYYYFKNIFIVHLTPNEAQKINNSERYFREGIDKDIHRIYKENWSENNFGPLIIPEGYYFVLGDNRNNTIDSRFQGLIPKENYKGKLFIK
jgi:signal peptidase I